MKIDLTQEQIKFLMAIFRYIDQSGFFANSLKEFKEIIEAIKNAKTE